MKISTSLAMGLLFSLHCAIFGCAHPERMEKSTDYARVEESDRIRKEQALQFPKEREEREASARQEEEKRQAEEKARSAKIEQPKGSSPKDFPKVAVWELVPREVKPAYAEELTAILVSEISSWRNLSPIARKRCGPWPDGRRRE